MKTIYKKLLFSLFLLPLTVFAQSNFNGTVVDKGTSQPLPGVNVQVLGTKNSAVTDFDGAFKFTNVKAGSKVVFSYVGYENVTVTYSGQNDMKITMEESSSKLSEVVIQVGYGTAKKKDLTGATTTITAKEFNKGAIITTENLLTGRVAGLSVNTGGAPGSGSEIRIRGGASLFGSNSPLIVIDGLPIANDSGTGSVNFLATLNPATIETFTVLKDASSTAIYGARAANGVIIITTKKGGKNLSVEYNVQYGQGDVVKTVDVFGADAFREQITARQPNLVNRLGNANTDWQRAIYQKTDFVDNSLSLRGNLFGFIPSRLTLGKTYQEGLRLTNTFARNTVGVALNPSFLNNHLKIKLNANYGNENNRFADGVEGNAIRFDPTQPVYDGSSPYGGFFEYFDRNDNNRLLALTPRNPVAQLLQTVDTGYSNRLFGNFEVDYKFHFLPSLRAIVNVGFDETWGQRTRNAGRFAATAGGNNNIPFGTSEFNSTYRKNALFDGYLAYNKTFGKLNFDATAGYSFQKFEGRGFSTGNRFDPTSAALDTPLFDSVILSYFARTNFSYNDKYILTLTARRESSSKFDPDSRTGIFPAAGFAWKLKEEFFKENKTISDLKLRLGYGVSGQQDVGNNNDYIQQFGLGNVNSQYIIGNTAVPIGIPQRFSQGLTWEKTTTYNAAVDYGLFNNRINGTVEAFYKESSDLLAVVPSADGSNFSNRGFRNIGAFTTKGLEFTINADIIKGDKLNWNVNFNVTSFKREITQLGNVPFFQLGSNIAGTGTQAQVFQIGWAPYSYALFKQLYDASGQPVAGAFADLNGDNVINANDKYLFRNPDPKAIIGFSSNFNYKNFDLFFNLRANIGSRLFNAVNANRAQWSQLTTGVVPQNIPTSVLESNFEIQNNQSVLSDYFVENGSFLRMDNVTLGYTFPKWLEGKASLRMFTGVQNAFIITKYSGLDPEIGNNGVDNTIYPRQRQVLVGANIKF